MYSIHVSEISIPFSALKGRGVAHSQPHRFERDARAAFDDGWGTAQDVIAEGEEAVLTVRDSGKGIDDLDALFEPFYTTKKPGEGVGLGLAISSGIVTDLGGRLLARNGDEGGAVFEVQLPILGTELAAAE